MGEGLGSPYSLTVACMMLGYLFFARGDGEAGIPVLERAYGIAREANVTLHRPQATRLLGGAYLLTGRTDEGVALVRAASDEIESRRVLMQQAAALISLGEAYLSCD